MRVDLIEFVRMNRSAGAVLAAAILSMASAPANAHSADKSITLGRSLNVAVTGSITPRCVLNGGADIDFGELRGGAGAKATFGLNCNVPFDLNVTSLHGGLAHVTKPGGEGPFSGLLPYDLHVTVPTLRPASSMVEGRYNSRDLTATRTLSSGDGISAGGGTIEFRTRQPEGAGLLAGAYSETIMLTVAPRM